MATVKSALWDELESAVQWGSAEKRLATLRRVTDLFLESPQRLSDEQIDVFDDVLCYLINVIESRFLVDISKRIASIDNAPVRTIGQLARDDEIDVAAPVLSLSPRLTIADLIEIASMKGQGHLSAISERRALSEAVTDILLARGNKEVVHKLVSNLTAAFSQGGFRRLVEASTKDAALAAKTGSRLDLPKRLLRELFIRTTAAGRALILGVAPEQTRKELNHVLSGGTEDDGEGAIRSRDFGGALEAIAAKQRQGAITEADLLELTTAKRFEEAVVVLATLCGTPLEIIKPLIVSERDDGLLVACKAADLNWETVQALLALKPASAGRPQSDPVELDYARLSKSRAQRILQFWQERRK
jgi:uncharacterized protein (DUF2336 family)